MDISPYESIVGLIGTLCLVILNAHLAQSKGREKAIWVFLTLIFGLFGTVMLLLADKVESQPAGQLTV